MYKTTKANRENSSRYYYAQCEKYPWYTHYHSARARCYKGGRYNKKGIRFYLSISAVGLMWHRDKAYLMNNPSIDRIDSKGDYDLVNCRFIELSENIRLGNMGNQNHKGHFIKNPSKSTLKMRVWRAKQ